MVRTLRTQDSLRCEHAESSKQGAAVSESVMRCLKSLPHSTPIRACLQRGCLMLSVRR